MAFDTKRMVVCRERFLTEMDAVIPWAPLLALIAPHFVKCGWGSPSASASAHAARLAYVLPHMRERRFATDA